MALPLLSENYLKTEKKFILGRLRYMKMSVLELLFPVQFILKFHYCPQWCRIILFGPLCHKFSGIMEIWMMAEESPPYKIKMKETLKKTIVVITLSAYSEAFLNSLTCTRQLFQCAQRIYIFRDWATFKLIFLSGSSWNQLLAINLIE